MISVVFYLQRKCFSIPHGEAIGKACVEKIREKMIQTNTSALAEQIMSKNPMETYPRFKKGQKVITVYGKTVTVLFQRDCQVFVREECGGWYHPTKIWAVKTK